jgi:hypothetical protein
LALGKEDNSSRNYVPHPRQFSSTMMSAEEFSSNMSAAELSPIVSKFTETHVCEHQCTSAKMSRSKIRWVRVKGSIPKKYSISL